MEGFCFFFLQCPWLLSVTEAAFHSTVKKNSCSEHCRSPVVLRQTKVILKHGVKGTKWSARSPLLLTLSCVGKAGSVLLKSVALPPFHHRLRSVCLAFIGPICWTYCWRKSCSQWLVIYLFVLPALMQSITRSRLFEFLAHGLVSRLRLCFLVSKAWDILLLVFLTGKYECPIMDICWHFVDFFFLQWVNLGL